MRFLGMLAGLVAGLIVGSVAVRETNQALCPHAILGPCRVLDPGSESLILVVAIVAGGIIGLIVGGRSSRPPVEPSPLPRHRGKS